MNNPRDERTELQRALDVIGEAASALEHRRPEQWFPTAIAALRAAAVLLKREANRADLLDYLNDFAGDCDLLFRRSLSPDSYHEAYTVPDGVMVIEVRQWEREDPPFCNEPWDTAEDALRRIAGNKEQHTPPTGRKGKKCCNCGNPATCYGRHEDMPSNDYSCDDCCGHGEECGRCTPVTPPARRKGD